MFLLVTMLIQPYDDHQQQHQAAAAAATVPLLTVRVFLMLLLLPHPCTIRVARRLNADLMLLPLLECLLQQNPFNEDSVPQINL